MASWKFETEWRGGSAVKVEKLSCKVEEEEESFNQLGGGGGGGGVGGRGRIFQSTR